MNRNSGRNADGTFGPGNAGKPKGTRHRATKAVLELLDGEAEALSRRAAEMARSPWSNRFRHRENEGALEAASSEERLFALA